MKLSNHSALKYFKVREKKQRKMDLNLGE